MISRNTFFYAFLALFSGVMEIGYRQEGLEHLARGSAVLAAIALGMFLYWFFVLDQRFCNCDNCTEE